MTEKRRGTVLHQRTLAKALAALCACLSAGVVTPAIASTTVTTFTYDAGDNVATITDPRGLITAYNYDGLGLRWGVSSPDTGTTTYNYDAYGRLSSLTRANNVTTTYSYDTINRLTGISAGGQTQTLAYDSCTNGLGRLCSAGDASGSTAYTYTPEGWVAGRGFSISGTAYSLGYGYDAMGNLAAVTYPDGNQAVYTYNNGAVSGVTFVMGSTQLTAASGVTWQPMNVALASWTSSNGLANTLSYDADGRVTAINTPGVESLGFNYDTANRLVGIDNALNGAMSQNFDYDDQSRLVSMGSTTMNASYGYDADGNRITGVQGGASNSISYSASSNRLVNTTGSNPLSYGYDALGNITTLNGTTTYQYDAFNRMSAAGSVSYYVNPEGQRLRKTGSGGTTYFAPDANGPLVAEDDNGAWIDYLWLGGQLIGREVNGQLEAIGVDQVGRPQVVTNAAQTVVWSAQNWPFTQSVTVSNSVPLNMGFPGQYYDAETGLWNNGFRDYDPTLGRYVESDPTGLAGGVNTYAYAEGNPLTNFDSDGLSCFSLNPYVNFIKPDDKPLEPTYPELAVFGTARLLYAGAAATIPSIAETIEGSSIEQAAWAISARNSLKTIFRLGLFQGIRQPSVDTVLARYGGNAFEAIAAAGRTNAAFNTAAAAGTAVAAQAAYQSASSSGSKPVTNDGCGCYHP